MSQSEKDALDAYRFTTDSLYIPADGVQVQETRDGYSIQGRGELLTAKLEE